MQPADANISSGVSLPDLFFQDSILAQNYSQGVNFTDMSVLFREGQRALIVACFVSDFLTVHCGPVLGNNDQSFFQTFV